MIGRFAPSPTGRMHLGNIWVALLSDLAVHAHGGSQILRIEDLDLARSSDAFASQLADDLDWLGLAADIGQPPEPLIRQRERTSLYLDIFESWRHAGRIYPCHCRRADLLAASAPHAEDGHRVYAGTCRPHLRDEPYWDSATSLVDYPVIAEKAAWRLIVEPVIISFQDAIAGYSSMNLLTEWGDFVIRRADGGFAYQLACAVDDALMDVDLVVRGRDLLRSTFPQIYIFQLLGKTEPTYAHVPLLIDPDGHRLSKRQQSLDIGALQAAGFTAEQLIGYLAHLAGLTDRPEAVSAQELRAGFSLEKIADRPTIVVDPAELYQHLAK